MLWTEEGLEIKERLVTAADHIKSIIPYDRPLSRFNDESKLKLKRAIKLLSDVFDSVYGEIPNCEETETDTGVFDRCMESYQIAKKQKLTLRMHKEGRDWECMEKK